MGPHDIWTCYAALRYELESWSGKKKSIHDTLKLPRCVVEFSFYLYSHVFFWVPNLSSNAAEENARGHVHI